MPSFFLAYALNQHMVGQHAATACELIQENQNNFIAEIILVLTLGALLFRLRFLWNTAPVLSISVAIASFMLLAFTQNNNEQLKTASFVNARVAKVWSAK